MPLGAIAEGIFQLVIEFFVQINLKPLSKVLGT